MRRIALDTETTGLSPEDGHRIVEIGCVELDGNIPTGNEWHSYVNPDRAMPEAAFAVHGLSEEFLQKEPKFKDIVEEFLSFIKGGVLVIHNAKFDIGFINNELKLINHEVKDIADICKIIDTVVLARKAFPGQKNNLNSLSARLGVSGYDRTYHGALLDAQILADTYLHLTGGQVTFDLSDSQSIEVKEEVINQLDEIHFTNFKANENDISEHNKFLDVLRKKSNKEINW